MKNFVIDKHSSDKNIIKVITKRYPHLNINTLNKAFREKDIKVNRKGVNKEYVTKEKDTIDIYIKDEFIYNIPNSIDVAFEDDNILVVYKPKGVISCKSVNDFNNNSINTDNVYFDDIVKESICKNATLCHRLDTNTEGLLIFAKNIDSYSELLKAFKEGSINKSYICLVHSKPEKKSETVSGYILEDVSTGYSKVYTKEVPKSSYVSTSYELIEYISKLNVSILKVTIHTGKTHQIRAHLKFLDIPIIGDSKYTPLDINKRFKLKYQVLYASTYSFSFDKSSKLYYLNDKIIDISDKSILKIKQLLNITSEK